MDNKKDLFIEELTKLLAINPELTDTERKCLATTIMAITFSDKILRQMAFIHLYEFTKIASAYINAQVQSVEEHLLKSKTKIDN
jgi:hypothetical protein